MQALNGSGHSPAKLTIDYVRQQGVEGANIPATNLNSVTVPGLSGSLFLLLENNILTQSIGAAAAWVDTVERFGSGKLTIADVLAPAIRLAEEGCVFLPLYLVLVRRP